MQNRFSKLYLQIINWMVKTEASSSCNIDKSRAARVYYGRRLHTQTKQNNLTPRQKKSLTPEEPKKAHNEGYTSTKYLTDWNVV